MARKGEYVAFQIQDVYLPGPHELLRALSEGERLLGTLSTITRSEVESEAYGVVELNDKSKVIVPIHKLHPVELAGAFTAEVQLEGDDDAD
ncbi:hypothetical protein [uncultured Paludibaculum sp.]|uniref:hypothetical protein n=1 Tax=uncultured Paludibaculum sp. TaxID=1765020 RepID=UPI002AAA662E|nr:hypothetical protein [uncultured Paludibaculum sp.]